jgi:hypothetical protein
VKKFFAGVVGIYIGFGQLIGLRTKLPKQPDCSKHWSDCLRLNYQADRLSAYRLVKNWNFEESSAIETLVISRQFNQPEEAPEQCRRVGEGH